MGILQLFSSSRKTRGWKKFSRHIAINGRPLLQALPRYPGAVLVAGCQRSGTTALTRVIAGAQGFCTFGISDDDELDAALILAGEEQFEAARRVCFQTTYLNDSYPEYISTPADFRLIWVIRNPLSVVYSMVYHWKSFALEDLYNRCGIVAARAAGYQDRKLLLPRGLSEIKKACFSYIGKSRQLEELASALPDNRLFVIDYDQLCQDPVGSLADVFAFIDEPFLERYGRQLHSRSMTKASLLKTAEQAQVSELCLDAYQRSLRLVSGRPMS